MLFDGLWEAHADYYMKTDYTECPKKDVIHKVNIPYYNVYTSFWDTLYLIAYIPILQHENLK
jgi:hypothetical protein